MGSIGGGVGLGGLGLGAGAGAPPPPPLTGGRGSRATRSAGRVGEGFGSALVPV